MTGDDTPPPSKPTEIDEDEDTVEGQTGRIFGAIVIVAILLALGAFFGLGGIHAIQWLWSHYAP